MKAGPCKLCKDTGRYRGYTGREVFCSCEPGQDARNADGWKAIDLSQMSEPERIAHMVRRNAEAYAKVYGYPRNLRNLCGLSSAALTVALRKAGFEAEAAEGVAFGYQHAWVVLGGEIIDITQTQFDGSAPKVAKVKTRDKRYSAARQHKDITQVIQHTWLRHRQDDIDALTTFDKPVRRKNESRATRSA